MARALLPSASPHMAGVRAAERAAGRPAGGLRVGAAAGGRGAILHTEGARLDAGAARHRSNGRRLAAPSKAAVSQPPPTLAPQTLAPQTLARRSKPAGSQ
eukprot:3180640-Prymnesium_polylepis.1